MSNAVEFHDRLAERWEAKYRKASFRAREDVLDRALAGLDLTGQRWLDAGCGTGTLSRALARRGCDVIGVDASVEMIRIAQSSQPRSGEYQQLDVMNIEQLGKFDGVLCNSVLEYLDQPEAFVAQCARCLHDDGMLLISVPNRRSLLRRALRLAFRVTGRPAYLRFSVNQYTRSEFAAMLDRHGLSVHRTEFFGGPLPRWLQRTELVGPLCMFVAYKRVILASA